MSNSTYENNSLIKVYNDTVKFFEENSGKFPFQPSKEYTITNYPVTSNKLSVSGIESAEIEVMMEDTFEMSERFFNEGLRPLVLNFASNTYPGGGVKKGAIAQEEDLFRRSNYHQSLNTQSVSYPLDGRVVYSPSVYVVRNSRNYRWRRKSFRVSCLAVAAIRHPEIFTDAKGKERFVNVQDEIYTRNSIRTIFHVAIQEGHDSLVLGAWGCGSFRGPKDTIAEIFAEEVKNHRHHFKRIGFGILVRNNHDQKNFDIFDATLSKALIGRA